MNIHGMGQCLLAVLLLSLAPGCTADTTKDRVPMEALEDDGAIHEAPGMPVRLALSGSVVDGETVLHGTVTVQGRIPIDASLVLVLPPGARLTRGRAQEPLEDLAPGVTLQREWRVRDMAGPAELTLSAMDVANRVFARSTYPQLEPADPPSIQRVPLNNVRVHGIPIRSSIRIGPADPAETKRDDSPMSRTPRTDP